MTSIIDAPIKDRVKAYEQALLRGEHPSPDAYNLTYATAQIARVRVGVEKPVR